MCYYRQTFNKLAPLVPCLYLAPLPVAPLVLSLGQALAPIMSPTHCHCHLSSICLCCLMCHHPPLCLPPSQHVRYSRHAVIHPSCHHHHHLSTTTPCCSLAAHQPPCPSNMWDTPDTAAGHPADLFHLNYRIKYMYSDSKNWLIKGHFLLWRQVVLQRTKLNPCEIYPTKKTILALCVPSIGHLALVIELI